jgi:hypothetical protein
VRRYRVKISAERGEETQYLGTYFLDAANLREACKRAREEFWDEELSRLDWRPVIDAEPVREEETTQQPEVALRLFSLPQQIQEAEAACVEAEEWLREAKEALADAEATLLIGIDGSGGTLLGKNAEARAAEMRRFTANERSRVAEAERALAQARLLLHRRQNEFAAVRTLAKLLVGEIR